MKQLHERVLFTTAACSALWYCLFHPISVLLVLVLTPKINFVTQEEVGLIHSMENTALRVGFYGPLPLGLGSWAGFWASYRKSENSSMYVLFFLKMDSFRNERKFHLSRCCFHREFKINPDIQQTFILSLIYFLSESNVYSI